MKDKIKIAAGTTSKKDSKKQSFGDIVFATRQKKQWTQQQLAAAAGVNQQLIDSIEATGGANTRLANAVRICKALGLPLNYIANAVTKW